MMKNILRNPLSIWLIRLTKSKIIEYKNRNKFLKIGYMSSISKCNFGLYNTIYDNVSLNEVYLDDFTYIASNTKISKTNIGKFCSIGPDCKIGLGKHPSDTFVSTHPMFFSILKQTQITFADKNYFNEFENITIGNDVWIGTNVIIVDGVTIGDGAIIAAGTVVTKDVLPYAIVGGIPAKIIRYRFKKNDIEALLNLKWWNMDMDYLKKNFKLFHKIDDLLKMRKS